MSEEQFWLCKQPPLQITISSYYSGLFGLYGLQIPKYWNLCFINSKWSQIYQKIRKNCIFDSLAFDLAFATFVGLFSIFLKSLMPDKTSGVQKLFILSLFHQEKKVNEIWHFRSVCGFRLFEIGHFSLIWDILAFNPILHGGGPLWPPKPYILPPFLKG